MCRFVAYLGREVALRSVVEQPEHSLVVQAYRPREMRSGVVNADGFGVGWYPGPAGEPPALFVSGAPIWADPNLAHLGRAIRSSCIFAAVRSATPGMPYGVEALQPFAYGPHLFVHNGYVARFRERLMRRLRGALRDELYAAIRGGSDSEHLFALWLEELAGLGSGSPALLEALRRTVARLERWVRDAEVEAALNLAVTDGKRVVACRYSTAGEPPSLYVADGEPAFPQAAVIASEPLYGSGQWRPVAAGRAVTVDLQGGVQLVPLHA